MERKWKTFKIITIVQIILTSICLALLCIAATQNNDMTKEEGMYFFIAALLILFALLSFYILCYLFAFVHYPSKIISVSKGVAFAILYIISLVIEIGVIFVIVFAINDFNKIENRRAEVGYFTMIMFFIIYGILLLHTLIFSLILKATIFKNASLIQNEWIENLGNSKNETILKGND